MRPVPRLGSILGVLALLLVCAHEISAVAQDRIVAVGDVHGAFPEFEAILKKTGLLEVRQGRAAGWMGGDATLIQLGDLLDFGPASRDCLDLMMELERSAQKQKRGKVVALLGDHEVMAMTGDFRNASPEDYASFATRDSEKIRQAAYRDYLGFLAADENAGLKPFEKLAPEKWFSEHPLGYFERRDAFGPQGVYGRWLRQQAVVYQASNIVFVHAGLSPNLTLDRVSDLNAQMRAALAAFDRSWQSLVKAGVIWKYMTLDEAVVAIQRERAALPEREAENTQLKNELEEFLRLLGWLISEDSPVWYAAAPASPALAFRLDRLFARLKIDHLVAGHAVATDFQIQTLFGDRLFLLDTGMFHPLFGGRPSALEILSGRFIARYLDRPDAIVFPRAGN